MKDNYIVYIYINKINNKAYIGQTKKTMEKRAGVQGQNYKTCIKFWNAIQKYGWDNFEGYVLIDNLTAEEANEYEEYFIEVFNTQNDDYGYNIQNGGLNHTVTEATKEKCRQIMLEEWHNPQKSEERYELAKSFRFRQAVSEGVKRMWDNYTVEQRQERISAMKEGLERWKKEHNKSNPFEGHKHTPEAIEKIRQANSGPNNCLYGKQLLEVCREASLKATRKPVYCVTTGQYFESITEAAIYTGSAVNRAHIGQCCSGERRTAGKDPVTGEALQWRFKGEEDKIFFTDNEKKYLQFISNEWVSNKEIREKI